MTRLEALRALKEAVEAGTNYTAVLDRSYAAAEAMGNVGLYARIVDAYSGSLNAARALHEAVLPGWSAVVNTNGTAQVIGAFPDWRRYTGCAVDRPARAWLLAVLAALIAQEEAAHG